VVCLEPAAPGGGCGGVHQIAFVEQEEDGEVQVVGGVLVEGLREVQQGVPVALA